MPSKRIFSQPAYADSRASATVAPVPVTPRMRPPFVTSCSPCSGRSRVEDDCAGRLRVFDPLDRRAGVRPLRIAAGREHDGHRGVVGDAELDPLEIPTRRGSERTEQIAVEARQDRLRLWVAEACVELEHLWPGIRQHQPGEQNPDERRAAAGELLDHRTVDPLHELRDLVRAETGDGRERAHPARVRARVAVADPFEVLRRCEGDDVMPVGEREDGDFVAVEQLLDHDRAVVGRRRAQPFVELLRGFADEDALAGGEPVHLDDTGRPRDRERLGRWHAGGGHDVLGEALRALDPRGSPARAEDGDPVATQRVAHAGDERRLRPDHGEVDVEAAGETQQRLGVLGPHRMAVAEGRDPGIPGRGVQCGQTRRLRQLPRQRMLATARPDEEHLHGGRVYSSGWRADRRGVCPSRRARAAPQ